MVDTEGGALWGTATSSAHVCPCPSLIVASPPSPHRNLLAFEILQSLLEKHGEEDVRIALSTVLGDLVGRCLSPGDPLLSLGPDNSMRVVTHARTLLVSGRTPNTARKGAPDLCADMVGGQKASRFARRASTGATGA